MADPATPRAPPCLDAHKPSLGKFDRNNNPLNVLSILFNVFPGIIFLK